jgi:hypothetical protein
MKDANPTIAAWSKMHNVDHRSLLHTGSPRAEAIQLETRS